MMVLLVCTLDCTTQPHDNLRETFIQACIAQQPAPKDWQVSQFTGNPQTRIALLRGRTVEAGLCLARTIREESRDAVEVSVWENADAAASFNSLYP